MASVKIPFLGKILLRLFAFFLLLQMGKSMEAGKSARDNQSKYAAPSSSRRKDPSSQVSSQGRPKSVHPQSVHQPSSMGHPIIPPSSSSAHHVKSATPRADPSPDVYKYRRPTTVVGYVEPRPTIVHHLKVPSTHHADNIPLPSSVHNGAGPSQNGGQSGGYQQGIILPQVGNSSSRSVPVGPILGRFNSLPDSISLAHKRLDNNNPKISDHQSGHPNMPSQSSNHYVKPPTLHGDPSSHAYNILHRQSSVNNGVGQSSQSRSQFAGENPYSKLKAELANGKSSIKQPPTIVKPNTTVGITREELMKALQYETTVIRHPTIILGSKEAEAQEEYPPYLSTDYLKMLPTGARVAAIDARNVQKRRQSLAEEKAEQKAFLRQFHNLPATQIGKLPLQDQIKVFEKRFAYDRFLGWQGPRVWDENGKRTNK